MNQDFSTDERRLLEATSQTQTPSEAELVDLRDSFLAFGKALERATGPRDEERILASLRDQADTVANRPHGITGTSGSAGQFRLWGLYGVAAALLLAAGLAIVAGRNPSRPTLAQPDQKSPPQPRIAPSQPTPAPELRALAENESPASPGEDSLAWDDTLDETFTSLEFRVQEAARLPYSSDAQLDEFYERVQSAASELDPGSL